MAKLYIRTPLVKSRPLGDRIGGKVWLKLESLQPSGSFKNRGMGAACQRAVQSGARQIVCSSGGNAGLAVAFAGRQLGVPVTIVVPESTGQRARSLIEGEGARVLVRGRAWDDAHQHALQLCSAEDVAYVHPFDDPIVWSGHSTLVDEVVEEGLKPDLVVVAVGGGGLFCGLMQGLERHGLHSVRVLAIETEGAASLFQAVSAGRLVELEKIESIATTLGARQVTSQALEYARHKSVITRTVSDREALKACLRFSEDHRLLVEPACGAALAAVYEALPPVPESRSVLVIACGGAGVTMKMLQQWQQDLGL